MVARQMMSISVWVMNSLDFNGRVPLGKNVSLTLNLENLGDNTYEKTNRIYQPGLTYRIGLQASF